MAVESMETSNEELQSSNEELLSANEELQSSNEELQSLNLTSLDDNIRVIYVDSNGQKAADTDITKSTTPESFVNLKSFKNAISGQAGTTVDTVNNAKMLVTYQPVKIFSNTWAVLLMQQPPLQQ